MKAVQQKSTTEASNKAAGQEATGRKAVLVEKHEDGRDEAVFEL